MDFPRQTLLDLNNIARQLRIDVIEMIYRARSGHPGGSLSAADIIASLFFHQLRLDPRNPHWSERDRFILSKGHAAPLLYAALARRGFFPLEELTTLRRLGSNLQGHPDRLKTPGVDMTTGALGHGLSIGMGLAYALRLNGCASNVYMLLGDGECQAGIIWEGAMAASKYRLSNLIAIVDYNGLQLDGPVAEIMPLDPMLDKWQAFNWFVIEIDGHDMRQILQALEQAKEVGGQPVVIVARTVKGKGVSFMENQPAWHGRAPTDAEYSQALVELNRGRVA